MRLLSAKSRITFGLACLLVSILCTAMMTGMVPEPRSAILAGRSDLCETIAVSSSDHISRGELRRLEFLLQQVVARSDDVLSAGVRRQSGQLVASVGDHVALWKRQADERSTESHVLVPIRSERDKWGSVELCFRPLNTPGFIGWLSGPWVRMTLFVTALSSLAFYFYLGKMLQHLDPSKSVPRRVRAALDSLAEGLLVIDRDQQIVLANQSFATWVGRQPEKLIGISATKLDWVRNEYNVPLDTYPWAEAIRLETPQAGVMLGLKQKNAPTRVLMANASPVLGHDGKYRGVLVSFDDVTQLEETKKDLQAAKQVAENANQAKSEFLARMSHEIRTPMNAILGYTDVLRRGFDDSAKDRQEYLDTIHGSGEHLLALINDILDLSKIESGRMELELQRCSPHKLFSQVVSLLRAKAEEKGITLGFECDGPLPDTILADAVRLRQAIMNLAGNAIKFTDQGGVRIVARLVGHGTSLTDRQGSERATPKLVVDVIDSGIGISGDAQKKIFDPFAQADTSITRRFGGTGLGLAISKQLAEAMGGGISVRSEPGQGSTFSIVVETGSLSGVQLVNADTALANLNERASEQSDAIQLPPARILVADDGESNRKLLELVLSRAGVDVVAVENGQEAVDRALGDSFDLILMDMQMPVMDGYTAATNLRMSGFARPIIALTAHAMRGDEEKCRAAGCSGFLTKPINIDGLLANLAEVLANESSHRNVPSDRYRDTRHGEDASVLPYDGPPRPSNEETPDSTASEGHRTRHSTQPDNTTDRTVVLPPQDVESPEDVRSNGDDSQERVLQSLQQESSDLASEVRQATKPQDDDTDGPILCSLPVDDPRFLDIAQKFVLRVHEKMDEMRRAHTEGNYAELAALAHWLKGSGGTVGFDEFTQPARELEMAAKSLDRDGIESLIDRLAKMTGRIKLPEASDAEPVDAKDKHDIKPAHRGTSQQTFKCASDGDTLVVQGSHPQQVAPNSPSEIEQPIVSSLPMDDDDFREIVVEFVARLQEKLSAMQQAWSSRDFDELAALAHWLKGCGGTAGFDAFTAPARDLERLARAHRTELVPAAIEQLQRLSARIVIPSTTSMSGD